MEKKDLVETTVFPRYLIWSKLFKHAMSLFSIILTTKNSSTCNPGGKDSDWKNEGSPWMVATFFFFLSWTVLSICENLLKCTSMILYIFPSVYFTKMFIKNNSSICLSTWWLGDLYEKIYVNLWCLAYIYSKTIATINSYINSRGSKLQTY